MLYLDLGEPRVWSDGVNAIVLFCFVWLSSNVRLSRSKSVDRTPKRKLSYTPCRHFAFKKLGLFERGLLGGLLVPLIAHRFGFSHTQPKKVCSCTVSQTHIRVWML